MSSTTVEPEDVNGPNSKKWYNVCKDYDSVLHDPDHAVMGNNFEFYGTFAPGSEGLRPALAGPLLRDRRIACC